MKRVVNKLENSKVEVLCDIETSAWKEAQEKAFKKLANELEVKGFRKGKVPLDIARKHIEQGKIINEAINSLLQPTFDVVLKEEKLTPFAQPTVDVTKVSDTDLQLKFTIVLPPEVTLGDYKGLNIEAKKVSVTKKEIDAAIERIVAQNASLVVSEEPAKLGDTVVIDFVGSVDGVEFDGGKADNYSLELGSHSFVPGFEDQLVGHKAGDDVDVNVTFPEQYVKDLAGKKALFKVKVHEVKSKVLPELNEELIKELNIPDVKTEEDLRKHQEKQLKSSKEAQAKSELLDKIMDKIIANAKIDLAKEIIDEEVHGMKHNMEHQVQERGMTLEQYLDITGQKPEDFDAQLRKDAERNLRGILVMEKIAETEKITLSADDVENEFKNIAAQYNMPVDQVKQILGQDMKRFTAEIRQRRIQDFLLENNTKKE